MCFTGFPHFFMPANINGSKGFLSIRWLYCTPLPHPKEGLHNVQGYFFILFFVLHELWKNIMWIAIWSILVFHPTCNYKDLDNKLDFWKGVLSSPPLPKRGGGRGEECIMKINFVFFSCSRPWGIIFFNDPIWFPPSPPILLCPTGWAFWLFPEFLGGDLSKWVPLWAICNIFSK